VPRENVASSVVYNEAKDRMDVKRKGPVFYLIEVDDAKKEIQIYLLCYE